MESFDTEFERARRLQDVDDHRNASRAFAALLASPENAQDAAGLARAALVRRYLGAAKLYLEGPAAARAEWERAIKDGTSSGTPLGMAAAAAATYDLAVESTGEEIVRLANVAVRLGTGSDHPIGLAFAARALGKMAYVRWEGGNKDEAIALNRNAIALLDAQQSVDCKTEKARRMQALGWELDDVGKKEEAIDVGTDAIAIAAELATPLGFQIAAATSRNLGLLYESKARIDLAADHFRRAIEYAEKSGTNDAQDTGARAARDLGGIHHNRDELEEACAAWKQSVRLGSSMRGKPSDAAAWASWDLGVEFRKAGKTVACEGAFTAAIQLGRDAETSWGFAAAAHAADDLGDLFAEKEAAKAVTLWRQAIEFARQSEDASALGVAAGAAASIARYHSRAGDSKEERAAYQRSWEMGMKSDTAYGKNFATSSMFNLGLDFEIHDEFAEAVECYKRAYEAGLQVETSRSLRSAAMAAYHLGLILHEKHDRTSEALTWLHSALNTARRSDEDQAKELVKKIEAMFA